MGIKSVVYRVTSREDFLMRRPKSVKTIDSTEQGPGYLDIRISLYPKDISIFIFYKML